MDSNIWTLKGRLILEGKLVLATDLHVGADELDITASLKESFFGLPDNPVIRDCYGDPFVPGSTVKGCLRSTADMLYHGEGLKEMWKNVNNVWRQTENSEQNNRGPKIDKRFYLPQCNNAECWVCRVFGRTSDARYREPTRLRVEDAFMIRPADPIARSENAIHRLLSAANPRRTEYVPRGTEFGLRMIYSVYRQDDIEKGVPLVLECMHHLEDTGIGGGRSRGAGGVTFRELYLRWKTAADYRNGGEGKVIVSAPDIREMIRAYGEAKCEIKL